MAKWLQSYDGKFRISDSINSGLIIHSANSVINTADMNKKNISIKNPQVI